MKKLQKLNGKKLNKKEQQAVNGGYIQPECLEDDYFKEQCKFDGGFWIEASGTRCGYCEYPNAKWATS